MAGGERPTSTENAAATGAAAERLPCFRIYRMSGLFEYRPVAELEATRPRTAMARLREAGPGATITCDGGRLADYLCVPAGERIGGVLVRGEPEQPPELTRLYRVCVRRPSEHGLFEYELEDELYADDARQVEGKLRRRLRKQGLRVRFGSPYHRRDAGRADVVYLEIRRLSVRQPPTSGHGEELTPSARLAARPHELERVAAQRAAFEAAQRAWQEEYGRRLREQGQAIARGECLVCLQRGKPGVRHDDPFVHVPHRFCVDRDRRRRPSALAQQT